MGGWSRGASIAMIAGIACSTYGESDQPPGPPNPMTDAAIDSPVDVDGAVPADGSPAGCVPEPIGDLDAGPESAACGPNGAEVQLKIDQANCGFCGNSCGTSTCSDGACIGRTVIATDQQVTVALPTDGKELYIGMQTNACATSRIMRVKLDAAPVSVTPILNLSSAGCLYWASVQQGRIFYHHTTTGIVSDSLANPGGSDSNVLVPSTNIAAVRLAGGFLYWVAYDSSSISRMSSSGAGPITPVHDDPAALVSTLDNDGDDVWWTTRVVPDGSTIAESALWMRAGNGASSILRAQGLGDVAVIGFDATHVYLASASGDVHRIAKQGSSPAELVTRVDTSARIPRAVFVVGDWLYVAVGNTQNSPFELYRAKKCGGRARRVARDYWLGRTFATPPGKLYYGAVGELRSIELTAP